jgi:hypothetical protein
MAERPGFETPTASTDFAPCDLTSSLYALGRRDRNLVWYAFIPLCPCLLHVHFAIRPTP